MKPSLTPKAAQTQPIRTLAQYRALVPGPPFPANAVALTIDDGPHPTWTPPILGLLDKYHLREQAGPEEPGDAAEQVGRIDDGREG